MRDMNETRIRGRLGETPTLTAATDSVSARSTLRVCTNYDYVNAKGEKVSLPTWHRVVVWGKPAENASKYLVKGQQVEITGRLQTREYEKDGKIQRITEIVAENVEYGQKPKDTVVSASNETPIVVKKQQQTVVRKKVSPNSDSESDPW